MAGRASTCPGRRRATRGTPSISPPAAAAAPAPAVAAGLILGGIGTDTGGSIRGPAALCGIAGHQADLRPRQPRRGRAGRVQPRPYRADGVDRRGLRAACCRRSPATTRATRPAPTGRSPTIPRALGSGIKGLKIGVIHHFHETDHKVSDGTQRGIDAAIATFRDLGAEIREVQLSPLQDWRACGSLISIVERAAAYEEWARTRLGDFGERMRSRLMLGAFVSGVDYVQAVRRRRELRAELQAAMAGLDVVLTAVAAGRGAKDRRGAEMGHVRSRRALRCRSTSPAIRRCRYARASARAGCRSRSSWSASRSRKPTVLRIADAFEKATPFRDRRPTGA